MSVNRATRNLVRSRANFLCEYCHSAEESSSTLFTIDHILPRSIGGNDELENLALACHRCNNNRYNFVTGTDPETEQEVTVFNPRQQQWCEHFNWSADGLEIMGITPTGRGTCDRLDLNDLIMKERLSELVVYGLEQGGILPLAILAKIYNIERSILDYGKALLKYQNT